MHLPVDERVRQFVRQQVADGIHNVAEVQRHTEEFVRRQLFEGKEPPSKINRRYFPRRRDYENIIYRARIAAMKSTVDQENLRSRSPDKDAEICFRPYIDPGSPTADVCETYDGFTMS